MPPSGQQPSPLVSSVQSVASNEKQTHFSVRYDLYCLQMCVRFPMSGKIKSKDMKVNWSATHVPLYIFCCAVCCRPLSAACTPCMYTIHCSHNTCTYHTVHLLLCSLLQATLGCLPVQEFSLNQDTQKIFRSASRLSKCTHIM